MQRTYIIIRDAIVLHFVHEGLGSADTFDMFESMKPNFRVY